MFHFFSIIFNFLIFLYKTINCVRIFFLNIIFAIVFFIIILFCFNFFYFSPLKFKGALLVDLSGRIVNKPPVNSSFFKMNKYFFKSHKNQLRENSLFDIVNLIRQAKCDDNITGMILSLENIVEADQTSLQYIGKTLQEFRSVGKPIYSMAGNYTQTQYLLASYSNKIYLSLYGKVDIQGMSINNFYYKTLLDKLKIDTHVFHVGRYKSAVEPFIRNNMSQFSYEDNKRWLDKIWENYLDIVSKNRNLTKKQLFPDVKEILNIFQFVGGSDSQFALRNKWVDEIISGSLFEKKMIEEFGWNKNIQSFNHVSIYDYKNKKCIEEKNKIAIIILNGFITDGTSNLLDSTNASIICQQIRDSRLNPNVKAVVIRVNSPGGSLQASEKIRSELVATRFSGKPVVISMGGIAASGGYWVSTASDYIIADSNTLTGSIGIFGIINTFNRLLDNIGVHVDGVSTSLLAGITSTKLLPNEYLEMVKINVENGYRSFIELVAKSRNKTLLEVDKVAQGHVWVGEDALRNGLVDQLGDFEDAINKSVELANLKNFQLKWYTIEMNFIDSLLMRINKYVCFFIQENFQYFVYRFFLNGNVYM
ncbi:MAG: protease IV, a signal peptide peptidase [Candidatus Westeberhardia cardiocondylae]|nr:protease IV, a signal peptide peptidase [Candidatus Westeberhardia cardiocondylae]